MSETLPPSVQAIRDNEEFVRRLARSLVRDPAAADDLAQDAWTVALRQPPRPVESLRAWIAGVVRNRAQDLARQRDRRERRERTAARSEIDDRERRASERVELQKRVLDAVVELPEAQRTAILLHHLEGLSCEEIARRRGVAASTVRAQVSRGLDALRTKLDRDFGERAAWSTALIGLLGAGEELSAPISTATLAVAAGVVVTLVGLGGVAYVASRGPARTGSAAEALSVVPPPANARSSSELETLEKVHFDSRQSPRAAHAAQIRWSSRPERSELDEVSIDELVVLGRMTQRAIASKLLAVSDEERAPAACMTKFPDSGVGRVLERGKFAFTEPYQRVGEHEFGCYLSFATGSNSFGEMPTLMFEDQTFKGASRFTAFAQLGYQNIALISDAPDEPPPAGIDPSAWEFLWSGARVAAWDVDETFVARARELHLGRETPAFAKGLWLVRAIAPGEYDLLAVFASLGGNDDGHSIGWRVLKRWPVEPRPRATARAQFELPPEPIWLTNSDRETLYAFQDELRTVGEARLLEVPNDISARAEQFESQGGGAARLVERERFGSIVGMREAGSYLSFATKSRHFDNDTDLGLQEGSFQGNHGGRNFGWIVDCGDVPLDSIGGPGTPAPETLNEPAREAWDLQRDTVVDASASLDDELVRHAREDLRAQSAKANAGHTYSMRSRVQAAHDILAAFRVERMDEHGVWITWRIVHRFDG